MHGSLIFGAKSLKVSQATTFLFSDIEKAGVLILSKNNK